MSDKQEWFIIIDNQQTGPLTLSDLKNHPFFSPDTLVWKKGMKEWSKARFIPELQILFKDEPEGRPLHELDKKNDAERSLGQESQVSLTLQQDPYQLLLWILLLLIIIFYTIFYHYH